MLTNPLDSNPSFQLTASYGQFSKVETVGLAGIGVGFLALAVALFGAGTIAPIPLFAIFITGVAGGSLLFFKRYSARPAGIQNDNIFFSPNLWRGAVAWILGVILTGFYVLLYWFPGTMEHAIRIFDPLSWTLRDRPADQWLMYGTFYTLAVLIMGVRAIIKYRHIPYQIVRSVSVTFFQLVLAFIIPAILIRLNEPELYFSYFWPLDFDAIWPSKVSDLSSSGSIGTFFLFWAAALSFVATPILTYFFGKRWYCSWVCGCGGLAETAGDPYRHLSDKSLKAWKIERWMIHSVLVAIVVLTGLLWTNSVTEGAILGDFSSAFARTYGFAIGAVFSGVIGVGFYPLMGARVWCRFGCPMAAVLGIIQKYFSRFRITTNGGQCISCGNCSTYCEMGIDVRWYAQRGQNIVRASCVGCGICSAVCPRGVLKLENGPTDDRYNGPILIDRDSIGVLD
ncbi:MAG: 4Fe-4S binding protein [Rhodothermales bacterium]|nr:4Fe-4S binding protein [Rhodothermales bacterium]